MSEHGPRPAGTLARVTRGAADTTTCASALAHEDREGGYSSINPANISTNKGCCGRSESGGHAGLVFCLQNPCERQLTQNPPGLGGPECGADLEQEVDLVGCGEESLPLDDFHAQTPQRPSVNREREIRIT